MGVEKIIKSIKRSKATGIDDLPPGLIKDAAGVLSVPLSHIINVSLDTGQFPQEWKSAKIIPLHKIAQRNSKLARTSRYVALAFDEMKIQSKLVFDKHTKELIGFVDLGDPDLNFACFEKAEELATHVLVFYVHGLASNLKFNLAYFATSCLTSFKIMSIFWKAVSILELSCSLPVITAVCDGASSNRKFFKMHEKLSGETNDSVTYGTVNLYAPDRYLWFFADAPHLIKTARNCLYHSGNNKPRLMWMNGKHLMWSDLCQIVNDDIANGLKICPKLTKEHTELTLYSVMNVCLAAQALSETTANVLSEYYGNAVESTALFCRNMDSFFDILNVRSPREGAIKRKESLKPFLSCADARFDWLRQEFLPYLEEWKKSVESTPYKASEKAKMFISLQKFEGLKLTSHSVIEATQFLLQNGLDFVLTNRFNQDIVEEHFGRQRSLGCRSDNPTLWQFGFNENTIHMQRSVVPATGNTKGGHRQKMQVSWSHIDNSYLKEIKSQ
eukprot:gene11654-12853_t